MKPATQRSPGLSRWRGCGPRFCPRPQRRSRLRRTRYESQITGFAIQVSRSTATTTSGSTITFRSRSTDLHQQGNPNSVSGATGASPSTTPPISYAANSVTDTANLRSRKASPSRNLEYLMFGKELNETKVPAAAYEAEAAQCRWYSRRSKRQDETPPPATIRKHPPIGVGEHKLRPHRRRRLRRRPRKAVSSRVRLPVANRLITARCPGGQRMTGLADPH